MDDCKRCPNLAGLITLFIGAVIVGWMLWMSGWAHGRHETYLEAVREGHAHWVPDKETGKPYIEWNKP